MFKSSFVQRPARVDLFIFDEMVKLFVWQQLFSVLEGGFALSARVQPVSPDQVILQSVLPVELLVAHPAAVRPTAAVKTINVPLKLVSLRKRFLTKTAVGREMLTGDVVVEQISSSWENNVALFACLGFSVVDCFRGDFPEGHVTTGVWPWCGGSSPTGISGFPFIGHVNELRGKRSSNIWSCRHLRIWNLQQKNVLKMRQKTGACHSRRLLCLVHVFPVADLYIELVEAQRMIWPSSQIITGPFKTGKWRLLFIMKCGSKKLSKVLLSANLGPISSNFTKGFTNDQVQTWEFMKGGKFYDWSDPFVNPFVKVTQTLAKVWGNRLLVQNRNSCTWLWMIKTSVKSWIFFLRTEWNLPKWWGGGAENLSRQNLSHGQCLVCTTTQRILAQKIVMKSVTKNIAAFDKFVHLNAT